jgi:tetrathionate reductase subunit B
MGLHDKDSAGPLSPISRREFLNRSSTALAGSMVIALVLPEGSSAGIAGADYDWDRHRWVYLIDTTKCIGCGSCVRACRAENSVPEEMYRTWVERYEIPAEGEAFIDSPDGGEHGFDPVATGLSVRKGFFVPKLCNHCDATPCIQVCPVGASFATRDGVVLVDPEHCIGCGYCVQAFHPSRNPHRRQVHPVLSPHYDREDDCVRRDLPGRRAAARRPQEPRRRSDRDSRHPAG